MIHPWEALDFDRRLKALGGRAGTVILTPEQLSDHAALLAEFELNGLAPKLDGALKQ